MNSCRLPTVSQGCNLFFALAFPRKVPVVYNLEKYRVPNNQAFTRSGIKIGLYSIENRSSFAL
jgi:hypothetical protein